MCVQGPGNRDNGRYRSSNGAGGCSSKRTVNNSIEKERKKLTEVPTCAILINVVVVIVVLILVVLIFLVIFLIVLVVLVFFLVFDVFFFLALIVIVIIFIVIFVIVFVVFIFIIVIFPVVGFRWDVIGSALSVTGGRAGSGFDRVDCPVKLESLRSRGATLMPLSWSTSSNLLIKWLVMSRRGKQLGLTLNERLMHALYLQHYVVSCKVIVVSNVFIS